jgi:hypothetical protein
MIRWAAVFAVLMLVFALFVPFEQVTTVLNTLFWVSALLFALTLVSAVFGGRRVPGAR